MSWQAGAVLLDGTHDGRRRRVTMAVFEWGDRTCMGNRKRHRENTHPLSLRTPNRLTIISHSRYTPQHHMVLQADISGYRVASACRPLNRVMKSLEVLINAKSHTHRAGLTI